MHTSITLRVDADWRSIFALASSVEDWPGLLPHYRWVRILEARSPTERLVDMAAWRDVLGSVRVPLHWISVQRVHADQRVIEFRHVKGISRGMHVEWQITPAGGGCEVRLEHVFAPAWPVPDKAVEWIVGEYFVNGVARRTLRRLAEIAELRKIGR